MIGVLSLILLLQTAGLCLVPIAVIGDLRARFGRQAIWMLLASGLLAGILANFAALILLRDLSAALLASLGLPLLLRAVRIRPWLRAISEIAAPEWTSLAVALAMILVLSLQTLLFPVDVWDARSIWFLHAKLLYHSHGLFESSGWTNPRYWFSHMDYPLLVPMLIAEVATFAGFWNEQLPKAGLLIMLLPGIFFTVGFVPKRLAFLVILTVVWMRYANIMVSGFMDAILASCALFGALNAAEWVRTRHISQLYLAAGFFGAALNIKNEGQLAIVALFAFAACLTLLGVVRTRRLPGFAPATLAAVALPVMAALGASLGWVMLSKAWALQNDLNLGIKSLEFALPRLQSLAALGMIAQYVFVMHGVIVALLAGLAALAFAHYRRMECRSEALFCFAVGLLYLFGLALIYLATPHDLEWHLASSTDRTTILGLLLFVGPVIAVLRDLGPNAVAKYSESATVEVNAS